MTSKKTSKESNAASLALLKLRWQGKTKAQRTAQGKLMAAARWAKKDA